MLGKTLRPMKRKKICALLDSFPFLSRTSNIENNKRKIKNLLAFNMDNLNNGKLS